MPNGTFFGVMTGTATSAHLRQFSTLWRARFRYALLLMMLRAVDAPFDLVLIDGEADYTRLKAGSTTSTNAGGYRRPRTNRRTGAGQIESARRDRQRSGSSMYSSISTSVSSM